MEQKLTSISEAARISLCSDQRLWLDDEGLKAAVQQRLGKRVSFASVDRCRRKIWETDGDLLTDPEIKQRYIKRRMTQEQYRNYFG